MIDIKNVRGEIDRIDRRLVELFLERLKIVAQVAESKRERGAPVNDPAREREILTRVAELAGPECENGIRRWFTTLFEISKARQRTLLAGESPLTAAIRESAAAHAHKFPTRAIVACCGTEGSYAQQAVSLMFPLPTIVYFNNFEKVFEAVEQGVCPYGILPIENSAAGSVAAVYDLMLKHRFHIARALRLKVDHVLLAPPGVKLEDVRDVASHPHALAQCKRFFAEHPRLRQLPGANTAVCAKEVASSGRRDIAAIASRACADLYSLQVIGEGIQDAAFNYTRFICISKELEVYPDADKITIMLSLPHRPGALSAIIAKFASIDVNLTKLESRPIPGMDFEFRFTFDFEARSTDRGVLDLLGELSRDPEIEHFDFLGAYAEK